MPASKRAAPKVDLQALGARVVSVCGPFNGRVLIEMSAEAAEPLFPDGFVAAARCFVTEATERDIEALRVRDPALAASALAASAMAMAFEIEHPYNSATSKSMCQARLADAMRELSALAPPEEKRDDIDRVADELAARRRASGSARAANQKRS